MRYFVFIDETGEANINNLDPRHNIFVLCGVLFREDHYNAFNTELKKLKLKHFGDESVVLHSYTMRKNKGIFKIFQDKTVLAKFYVDMEAIFKQHKYRVLSCIVDKEGYKEKYPKRNFAYEDALTFLCERAMSCIGDSNKKNSLLFCLEKRGNKKDRELKRLYTKIVRFGTEFKSTADFQVCDPYLFFRGKDQNINGLQLADLCAYPIARKILSPNKAQPTYDLFVGKIYCNWHGQKRGFGLKFFP